jgi:hypothetical protein
MDQPVEEVVMVDIEKETVEREVIVVPSLLATILSQCVTSLLPDRSHLRSAPANLRKFGTLPSTRGSMRWPGWERHSSTREVSYEEMAKQSQKDKGTIMRLRDHIASIQSEVLGCWSTV